MAKHRIWDQEDAEDEVEEENLSGYATYTGSGWINFDDDATDENNRKGKENKDEHREPATQLVRCVGGTVINASNVPARIYYFQSMTTLGPWQVLNVNDEEPGVAGMRDDSDNDLSDDDLV